MLLSAETHTIQRRAITFNLSTPSIASCIAILRRQQSRILLSVGIPTNRRISTFGILSTYVFSLLGFVTNWAHKISPVIWSSQSSLSRYQVAYTSNYKQQSFQGNSDTWTGTRSTKKRDNDKTLCRSGAFRTAHFYSHRTGWSVELSTEEGSHQKLRNFSYTTPTLTKYGMIGT